MYLLTQPYFSTYHVLMTKLFRRIGFASFSLPAQVWALPMFAHSFPPLYLNPAGRIHPSGRGGRGAGVHDGHS